MRAGACFMSSANSFPPSPLLEEVRHIPLCETELVQRDVRRGIPPKQSPFGGSLTTFLVLAAPAFWLAWLIYQYGVDTPWGDQWDATRLLLEKMDRGTLGFSDFFAFHNEHRIFFPQLLSFVLARLTHWNIRAELLVIWMLTCRRSEYLANRANHRLAECSSARLAPSRSEHPYLFSFAVGKHALGIPDCFHSAARNDDSISLDDAIVRHPFNFIVTSFLCLITTFSIASGFASWFLATPLLLVAETKRSARSVKMWWIGWMVFAVASICLYFYGYKHPFDHPSLMVAFQHPIIASQFFLAYLGNPFCSGTRSITPSSRELRAQRFRAAFRSPHLPLPLLARSRALVNRCRGFHSSASGS